jgi:hypothetical protein
MNKIQFSRINNDINGNPRYVCHFLNLLTDREKGSHDGVSYSQGTLSVSARYDAALKRSRQLGGRKFHNKQYGGGIVFQSYNIDELEAQILALVAESYLEWWYRQSHGAQSFYAWQHYQRKPESLTGREIEKIFTSLTR